MRDIDVVSSVRPSQPGAFMPSDLDEVPEDVVRCELVDGALVARRPPSPLHQAVLLELACTLRCVCPEQLQVLPAPVRFEPAVGLSLLPDVVVCRREDVGDRRIERPLLAVAVVSQGTRELDTGFRQALYELSKVPSYWLFDPAKPSLTVRELVDGEYAERTVVGDEVFEATAPFAVRIVPGELVR
jgi:Uma2 family endonuclease